VADVMHDLRSMCDRISSEDSAVRAFVPGTFSRERIMDDASKLLEQYPDPHDRPALFGTLLGVKDIFNVETFETRAGSELPPALFAGPEASAVTTLKNWAVSLLASCVAASLHGRIPPKHVIRYI
jgi:Asp-tRNA(Asn)/Glu-tRNA(Gln) amidotransferase A subunit family amidase